MDRRLPALIGSVLGITALVVTGSVYLRSNEGGPLEGTWGDGEVCLTRVSAAEFTHTVAGLRNLGDQPARITAVVPYGMDGVRFVEAVVVPVGHLANGTASQWPPAHAVNWESRQDAVGVRIPPMSVDGTTERGEEKAWNVVLHLSRTDRREVARLAGTRIEYRVGHRRYHLTSTLRFGHGTTACQ